MSKLFHSLETACAVFNLSERTLIRYLQAAKIQPSRVGRRLHYILGPREMDSVWAVIHKAKAQCLNI